MERAWTFLALMGSLVVGCAEPRDERVLGELSASDAMSACDDLVARGSEQRGDPQAHAVKFCTWIALWAVLDRRADSCAERRDECIDEFQEAVAAEMTMGLDTPSACPALTWPAACSATVEELVRCTDEANDAYLGVLDGLSCDELPASSAALEIPAASDACAWMYDPACTPLRTGEPIDGEAP